METQRQPIEESYRTGAEPHFDEEWTLISARQVVPLEKLKDTPKRRGKLKLIGAFVGAIVLGAAVALLSIRLESKPMMNGVDAELATEETQPVVEQPQQSDKPLDETSAVSLNPDETEPVVNPKPRETVTEKPKNSPERRKVNDVRPAPEVAQSDPIGASSESQDTEARAQLVDEWQERRARRVRPRERSDRMGRHRRGLTRIDEIFEGRPRP
jgi:outer membrane biosynthesis protein TonB